MYRKANSLKLVVEFNLLDITKQQIGDVAKTIKEQAVDYCFVFIECSDAFCQINNTI